MNKVQKSKAWVILNYLGIPVLCIFVSLYVFFGNQREEYNLMFLLPIAFLLCYELFLKNSFKSFTFFSISYTLVSLVRFVFLPLLIVLGGRYDGRSATTPSEGSFVLAFVLMIIELFICSLLIWVLARKLRNSNKDENEKKIKLPKQWTAYTIFVLVAIIMLIAKPELLSAFSFITPHDDLLNYNDFDVFSQIAILCLNVAKNLVALMSLVYCYKRYSNQNRLLWVALSFIIISLNSSVYFGTNRFDFVLNLAASTTVFCILYRKYWKVIATIMSVLCLVGFVSISQARSLRGAINNDNEYFQIADLTQMYFGGPYNVAIAIETAEAYPEGRTLKTAFYDCTRSVLGLNVIVRNVKGVELSSHYYNRRIFNSSHSTQIIPMIGEGYYLFGILFAPIFDVMFILLAYLLTKQKNKVSIEIWYFFVLSLMRLGFINCQSATIQLNDLSFNLFMPLILYFINNLFQRTSNKKEREI